MWPKCQHCGERQEFKLVADWLVCKFCEVRYRPVHADHVGGPTPDNCSRCYELGIMKETGIPYGAELSYKHPYWWNSEYKLQWDQWKNSGFNGHEPKE